MSEEKQADLYVRFVVMSEEKIERLLSLSDELKNELAFLGDKRNNITIPKKSTNQGETDTN